MLAPIRIFSGATVAALCACSHPSNPIEGDWSVDMAPMVVQANGMGASAQDIRQMKGTFAGAHMNIGATSLRLSIAGESDAQDLPYTIKSVEGDCQRLDIQGMPGEMTLCVKDDRLEFHDPSTPLVVTYRRS